MGSMTFTRLSAPGKVFSEVRNVLEAGRLDGNSGLREQGLGWR